MCKLDSDEFFWFDIVGLDIIDNGVLLGVVEDIERIGHIDYLIVRTNMNKFNKPKSFMIPYIDRYITNVDLDKKIAVVDVDNVGDNILANAVNAAGFEAVNITEH